MIRLEHEHPAQGLASAFLRAIADDDARTAFDLLSRETRGLLVGAYAARAGIPLHEAAAGDRIRDVLAPLRSSVIGVLGGADRVGSSGVSGGRVVGREIAYVLLIPEVEQSGIVTEAEWRPAHLLAFVHESREWLVDLGRTAALSSDAGLPDPFGGLR